MVVKAYDDNKPFYTFCPLILCPFNIVLLNPYNGSLMFAYAIFLLSKKNLMPWVQVIEVYKKKVIYIEMRRNACV